MAVLWRRHVQSLQQQPLARRIRQMIFAAHHMGDSHQRIIQRVAVEESRGAILAPDDKIPDVIGQKALGSMHQIVELNALTGGYVKTQGWLNAFVDFGLSLLRCQFAARARITRWPSGGKLRTT